MMLVGLCMTPFSARIAERIGLRVAVVSGLLSMTAGLVLLSLLASGLIWALATLMVLVGFGGPLSCHRSWQCSSTVSRAVRPVQQVARST